MSEGQPRSNSRPLIVTAELPPELHARFTALRREHYPPERNFLEAHVTLFHALPPMCADELAGLLAQLAGEFAPVAGRVAGVMPLARGAAIRLESPGMDNLRALIAEHFHGMLSMQDLEPPRLHVTIQNKVAPVEAKKVQNMLAGTIGTGPFAFRGLSLFAWLGGPWRPVSRHRFRGKAAP